MASVDFQFINVTANKRANTANIDANTQPNKKMKKKKEEEKKGQERCKHMGYLHYASNSPSANTKGDPTEKRTILGTIIS